MTEGCPALAEGVPEDNRPAQRGECSNSCRTVKRSGAQRNRRQQRS